MTRLSAFATVAALAACTPTPAANDSASAPAEEAPTMQSNQSADESAGIKTCDAAKVQDVIGKPASEVVTDAVARAGAGTSRTIAPGQAVTMDYRTDRLNVETDAKGIVTAVRCG